jgi:hypothetical protein
MNPECMIYFPAALTQVAPPGPRHLLFVFCGTHETAGVQAAGGEGSFTLHFISAGTLTDYRRRIFVSVDA